jgi:hypothetical protein
VGGPFIVKTVSRIHPAKVRETFGFADFESLEIYGEPDDALEEWIARVSEGVRFSHHAMHWGGVTRLTGAESPST